MYFEVPTGTYQGRTIHTWLAYNSMWHPNWYGTEYRGDGTVGTFFG